MPLDRVTEDLQLRQAQILLEQTKRQYFQRRDDAAVQVRQAARGIETAQFSLVIQEKNVQAAMNRQAAIDAAPDRATARDRTEAVEQLRQHGTQIEGYSADVRDDHGIAAGLQQARDDWANGSFAMVNGESEFIPLP